MKDLLREAKLKKEVAARGGEEVKKNEKCRNNNSIHGIYDYSILNPETYFLGRLCMHIYLFIYNRKKIGEHQNKAQMNSQSLLPLPPLPPPPRPFDSKDLLPLPLLSPPQLRNHKRPLHPQPHLKTE